MIICVAARMRARDRERVTAPLCPRPYQRRAVGLLPRAGLWLRLLGKLPLYPPIGDIGKLGKLLKTGRLQWVGQMGSHWEILQDSKYIWDVFVLLSLSPSVAQ